MNQVYKTGRRMWKLVNKTGRRGVEPDQYDRKTSVEAWSMRQKEALRMNKCSAIRYNIQTMVPEIMRSNIGAL